jgi:hypothetical protein
MAQIDILQFMKIKRMESDKFISTSEIVRGVRHLVTTGTKERNILRQQLNKLYMSKIIDKDNDGDY